MQKNMQNMSNHLNFTVCREYDKKYARYARYANKTAICRVCTPLFARDEKSTLLSVPTTPDQLKMSLCGDVQPGDMKARSLGHCRVTVVPQHGIMALASS